MKVRIPWSKVIHTGSAPASLTRVVPLPDWLTLKTIFLMVLFALLDFADASESCFINSFTSLPQRRTAFLAEVGAAKTAELMLTVFTWPRTTLNAVASSRVITASLPSVATRVIFRPV